MARLFKEKPQVIVLDMSRRYGADFGFTSYDQAWLDRLTLVVKTLRGTGAKVLMLGPVAVTYALLKSPYQSCSARPIAARSSSGTRWCIATTTTSRRNTRGCFRL